MRVLILLVVVGSAFAAPQFASNHISSPSSVLTPPTPGFNPQTFGVAASTNQNTRSFTPTLAVSAPQATRFQSAPVATKRVFNLDSDVFAPEGGVVDASPTYTRDSFDKRTSRPYAVIARSEYLNDNGEFASSFKQSNGAHFSETGSLKPTNDGLDNVVVKTGSYGYTSPEGLTVFLSYTADEYGFHPVSTSIPQDVAKIPPTF